MSTEMDDARDRQAIRELVENWAVWRDAGDWERLRTLWHAGGTMVTTWCELSGKDFVDAAERASKGGAVNVSHTLGGCSVDVRGDRAVAQTKMTITQRAMLNGVEVDVNCMGRFYDLLERGANGWGIVLRQPIYERDRIDAVDPGARLSLDAAKLAEFPEGYRHLGYLQALMGLNVARDLPGRSGPALEALYARGCDWLDRAGPH